MGGEFRSAVGGYMKGNAVFREDMRHEGICDVYSSDTVGCGDEDGFLREAIDNDKDRGETVGGRELLDEIHANRMPRAIWDG